MPDLFLAFGNSEFLWARSEGDQRVRLRHGVSSLDSIYIFAIGSTIWRSDARRKYLY